MLLLLAWDRAALWLEIWEWRGSGIAARVSVWLQALLCSHPECRGEDAPNGDKGIRILLSVFHFHPTSNI